MTLFWSFAYSNACSPSSIQLGFSRKRKAQTGEDGFMTQGTTYLQSLVMVFKLHRRVHVALIINYRCYLSAFLCFSKSMESKWESDKQLSLQALVKKQAPKKKKKKEGSFYHASRPIDCQVSHDQRTVKPLLWTSLLG